MRSRRRGVVYTVDRGVCAACGRTLKLRQLDGFVKAHDGCPGGGRPPAKTRGTETVDLPDPT